MLKILLKLTFYILILGQLTNISKGSGINLYLFDILVFLFAFSGIFYFLIAEKSIKIDYWHIIMMMFAAVALLSLLIAVPVYRTNEILISAFYLIRYLAYFISGVVVYNMVTKKHIDAVFVEELLINAGLFLAFTGFIQLIILPDFSILDSSLGWDPHKNRLAGSFFDPNFTGSYLVICLLVLLDRFYSQNDLNKINILKFLVLLLALFLTFSRSSWGMFAVVVVIYGFLKYKKLLIVAFMIAFSTYFAVPRVQTRISGITDPADSAAFRLISWSNTYKVIKDNTLFGVGFNTYRYAQKDYNFLNLENLYDNSGSGSDSSFMFVFATTGIAGFVLYSIGYLYPFIHTFVTNNKKWILILSMQAAFLVGAQFINSLFYPQVMFAQFTLVSSYLSGRKP